MTSNYYSFYRDKDVVFIKDNDDENIIRGPPVYKSRPKKNKLFRINQYKSASKIKYMIILLIAFSIIFYGLLWYYVLN